MESATDVFDQKSQKTFFLILILAIDTINLATGSCVLAIYTYLGSSRAHHFKSAWGYNALHTCLCLELLAGVIAP